MPGRIYTRTDGGIRFEIHLCWHAIVNNHSTTMSLTHVELHVVGVIVLIGMAVNALSIRLTRDNHVVVDFSLIEIGKISLVDAQHFVCHVGRRNETIRDVWVDFLFSYMDGKFLECFPTTILLGKHFHLNTLSFGCFKHFFPFVLIDENLVFHTVGIGRSIC